MKIIKPQVADRWDQFEKAAKEGWIADNVHVVIAEDWLGGEIWHAWFAARARMLEYTLELERKIADANLAGDNKLFVLSLCSDGFRWQQDGLEDFVSFYRGGIHRAVILAFWSGPAVAANFGPPGRVLATLRGWS